MCIKNFVSDRESQVHIKDTFSSGYILDNDVPQGAILSPILFNIAINDIVSVIQRPIKITLFADDLALILPCFIPQNGEEVAFISTLADLYS